MNNVKKIFFLCIILMVTTLLMAQNSNKLEGTFVMSQAGNFEQWENPSAKLNVNLQPYVEFSGNTFTMVDYIVRDAVDVVTVREFNRLTFFYSADRSLDFVKLNSWNKYPQAAGIYPDSERIRRVIKGKFDISMSGSIEFTTDRGTIKAFPFSRTANTVTIDKTQFSRKPALTPEQQEALKFVGKWKLKEGADTWAKVLDFFNDGTGMFAERPDAGFFYETKNKKLTMNAFVPNLRGLINEYDYTISNNQLTLKYSGGSATWTKVGSPSHVPR